MGNGPRKNLLDSGGQLGLGGIMPYTKFNIPVTKYFPCSDYQYKWIELAHLLAITVD